MEKNIKIRMARAQDAEALARIYAYYVEKTAITFEHEAPDAAEMETRRKKIFEHSPYLVAEQEGRVLGYQMAGIFHQSGYKFGRWYDVAWMEKMLGKHEEPPAAVWDFHSID